MGTSYATWVEIAQIGSLLLAITIVVLEIWRAKKRNGGDLDEPVLLIVWMIHSIVFYIGVLLNRHGFISISNSHIFFASWSATLRLHGYTSLLILCILRVNRRKQIKRRTEGILYGSDCTDR